MREIILKKRYPHSREEDITDAFMRGYEKGKADRPQGEWIYNGNFCGMNHHKCSVCGRTEFRMSAYCPNCGARMKGADDEDD